MSPIHAPWFPPAPDRFITPSPLLHQRPGPSRPSQKVMTASAELLGSSISIHRRPFYFPVRGLSIPWKIESTVAPMIGMTAIRVIFDGKATVPQQPVSLPLHAEAVVLVDQPEQSTLSRLDAETREYYRNATADADDDTWASLTALGSSLAWEED